MATERAFLDGYVDLEQFAAQVGRSARTIRNWMDQPDNALPFRQLGSRRLIHLEIAREWLLRGVKPRKRRGRQKQ